MPDFADCSIVILAHNGHDFTERCLGSLLLADPLPRELLVVDNGSDDDTPALLAAFGPRFEAAGVRWTTWRNAENLGTSDARNAAWGKATATYVLFMDNDTAVCTRDFLARLCAKMDADPTLGVLGPKLIYPHLPHPIQCAGVAINPRGRIRFKGRGARRDDPEYAVATTVPALISATWIKRRALLEEIGGLDPLFHPVQFEDLDFCLRVNAAGYHCAYTPDVEVYHFEGSTTGSFGALAYQRTIAENSAKFRQRWREVLTTYPDDPADYRWLDRRELGLSDELDLTLI